MKITITGRHFEITPALREYLEEKFSKLEKYAPDIVNLQVILQMEKRNAILEANVKLKKFRVNVKEKNRDMYTAIDKVLDILKKQIVRHEKKMKAHRHRKKRI